MNSLFPRIALVANGEIASYSKTKALLATYEKIIAVDGGFNHCKNMGIIPDCVIGDLDSISSQELINYPEVAIQKFPRDKNESDLELAIHLLLDQGVEALALFGVLGLRTDHLLYTLYLLTHHSNKLIIESEKETIFCLQEKNHIPSFSGQVLSLIPLNEVTGVTTEGLKWEIHDATLDKKFMSLSNVSLEDSFKVSLKTGDLLCCLQK